MGVAALDPSYVLRPYVLRPCVLRPYVLRPCVLRPYVLRPCVLRPCVRGLHFVVA